MFDTQYDAAELDVLLAALEQPETERLQWLNTQTQLTGEQRQRLLVLLQDPEKTSVFQQHYADSALPDFVDDQERVGQLLDGYRLDAVIGQGGMGVVYRAERVQDYQQACAVKLIRGGAINAKRRKLFIAERQILANLEHPNIARLLDGGKTPEGDDYLVMEYVQGSALLDYCQALGSFNRVLQLFMSIAAAVEYAHSQLLVHGDLKPANILVTETGAPKLLDFGIARYVSADDSDSDTQAAAMTFRYASPEQQRGQGSSVVSDIYSLTLIFREMLATTKQKPPADLQAIIDKGTAATINQRYATVGQLLNDCRAWRQHQPVEAYAGGRAYRWRKLWQRQRLAVSLSGLVVLSLSVGLGLTWWQANRAQQQQQQAEQFSDTLVSLLSAPDPYQSGSARTVTDMLDHAAEQFLDANNQLQLPVRNRLLALLAEVYTTLGELDRAQAMVDQLAGYPDKNDTQQAHYHYLQGLVHSRNNDFTKAAEHLTGAIDLFAQQPMSKAAVQASAELGAVQLLNGQERAAIATFSQLLLELNDSQAFEPGWLAGMQSLAYNDMGIAYEFLGELDAAREQYTQSIKYLPEAQNLALATGIANLASAERKLGHTETAIELLEQSLQMHIDVVGADHIEVSMIHSDLSLAYQDVKQADKAILQAQSALNNALKSSGDNHRNTAAAYFALGNAWLLAGDLQTAYEFLIKARDIRTQLIGADHPRTQDVNISIAAVLCNLTEQRQDGVELFRRSHQKLLDDAEQNRFLLERAERVAIQCQPATQ